MNSILVVVAQRLDIETMVHTNMIGFDTSVGGLVMEGNNVLLYY